MSEVLSRETKRNATDVDRELEKYSMKFLSGSVSAEDKEHYEKLLSWRRLHLVKLPPVKVRSRWNVGKKAS